MPHVDHDSGLALLYGSWSDVAAERDLPVLDLNSTEPLSFDLDRLPELPQPRPPAEPIPAPVGLAPALPEDAEEEVYESADGTMWLRGDVLMCACPECSAPMSVRLWLMLADCWRCATTIELNEEQEREVQRLLEKRERARRAVTRPQAAPQPSAAAPVAPAEPPRPKRTEAKPPPPPVPEKKEPPATTPREQPPPPPAPKPPAEQPQQPRRVAASKKPIGVRAKYRKMAVLGAARVMVNELFKQMPAWMASLLFHLIVAALLMLIYIGDEQQPPTIVLSVQVNSPRIEGGDVANIVRDEPQFDLPVMDKPKTENQMRALILADQEARQLRVDPAAPLPQLPDLNQVKQIIGATDVQRRMLAARDPRVRVEMVKREGGTTMTEAAVARGLRWLSAQQNQDGGWALKSGRSDAAGTSLALLPFLGAGQTHQTGIYQEAVSKGLRWFIDHQKPDGDLRHGTSSNHGMYAHGQAAIVLCEAYAMTGDEQLRIPAQKAIDFIVMAQHPAGGWRYSPGQEGDMSVVGWQLMALQSARAAKLTVPDSTLELASHFLDSVSHADGAQYSYQPRQRPNEAMTAEGLLSRMYLGWNKRDNPPLVDGVAWLVDEHLPDARKTNMYYWYYATQVMHHHGGPEWERWNLKMRHALTETQVSSGRDAGSWSPGGRHGAAGGRLYMTSLATCTLEVYYRHAPIFRQIKLD
jgi:hypothetical protein